MVMSQLRRVLLHSTPLDQEAPPLMTSTHYFRDLIRKALNKHWRSAVKVEVECPYPQKANLVCHNKLESSRVRLGHTSILFELSYVRDQHVVMLVGDLLS